MSPCIQLGSVWGRQISISEVYHSMASLAYTSHTSQPQLTAINKFFRRPNLNLHQDLGPAFGSLPHVRACCHIHIRAGPSRRIIWNLSEKHRGELMNFLIFLQNSLAARSCPDLFYGISFCRDAISWFLFQVWSLNCLESSGRSVGRFTAWIMSQLKPNS